MYLSGTFTQEKYEALLNAALDGETEAMYELGMLWLILGSQQKDEERINNGMDYLLDAADNGSSDAACLLGTVFHEGKYGIAADKEKAFTYYKLAADGGNALAMSNYGIALQKGDGGLPCDPEQAFIWLKKAADTDESLGVAQYNVALACHAGLGTKIDRIMAKHYFERASKAGIEMASFFLLSNDYK
jgi:TPR repeat protein